MIGTVCVPWVSGWSLNHPLGSWVRKYLLTRTTSVLILESLPYNESRVDSLIGWSDAVQLSHWLRTWHTQRGSHWLKQQLSQLWAQVNTIRMSEAGVFGASKAGAVTDPMAYLRKPSVVFRIGALVSHWCGEWGATSDLKEHGTFISVGSAGITSVLLIMQQNCQ